MIKKYLDFDHIEEADRADIPIHQYSNQDIAIIGMSGQFGGAGSIEELWEELKQETDFITDITESRKRDVEQYLQSIHYSDKIQYAKAGYLSDISHFDHEFFQISPREADLMDPVQRLMIECIYETFEDAGYGGDKMKGSSTGVYIGYSNDFDTDYSTYISACAGWERDYSTAGNIRSVIAGRIAYFLDMKGPCMLLDTACSSSLVAVHSACQAIRSQECDMAVAGGINLILLPLVQENELNILSKTQRSRTFNQDTDGTGRGEGFGAVLLKRMDQAVLDGDSIYAVIKGSSMNQDGKTAGITAPNPVSQEKVIRKAWKQAGINPEDIGYIEAHGTGTKLGDPIEVESIERAFRHYTEKKQFCAIGSVKTNLGHLDNASGILSLIKAVYMLKYKMLLPTIHFENPNRKIHFMNSPVYVNDTLRPWKTAGKKRICGISSFGLSGTNCHIVLEEAEQNRELPLDFANKPYEIFTVSARTNEGVRELLSQYREMLFWHEEWTLEQICYTANTGRGQYGKRIALIVSTKEELLYLIEKVLRSGLQDREENRILIGTITLVSVREENTGLCNPRTKEELDVLSKEAAAYIESVSNLGFEQLQKLCHAYINGARIVWEQLYQNRTIHKIELPVYPFQKNRCWLPQAKRNRPIHPLIGQLETDTMKIKIFQSVYRVPEEWVLREHVVAGKYVVPGTAYIDVIYTIAKKYYGFQQVCMTKVMFVAPLELKKEEQATVHFIFEQETEKVRVSVESRKAKETGWRKHAECFLEKTEEEAEYVNLKELKSTCTEVNLKEQREMADAFVQTGPRWDNLRTLYVGKQCVVAYHELALEYQETDRAYRFHPALLDRAVNAGIGFIGAGNYLPWYYKDLTIYGEISDCVVSYITREEPVTENPEAVSFGVTLLRRDGKVLARSREYLVKRVRNRRKTSLYQIQWIEEVLQANQKWKQEEPVLVIVESEEECRELRNEFTKHGFELIFASCQNVFEKTDNTIYDRTNREKEIVKIAELIDQKGVKRILHMAFQTNLDTCNDAQVLKRQMQVFGLLKTLSRRTGRSDIEVIFVLRNAFRILQQECNPLEAGVAGLGKVIPQEFPKISCRAIDIDDTVPADVLWKEICSENRSYLTALRGNKRYVEELREMKYEKAENRIHISDGDVILITGGLGGIGLAIAERLTKHCKANICLIHRSAFPPKEQWEQWLQREPDSSYARIIQKLQTMEKQESNVVLYQADVTKYDEMKKMVQDIRNRFGQIKGVFHCAGVAGNGFLIKKDSQQFREVLAPKINGTLFLDRVLAQEKLEFFVLFSSIASVFGVAGQADYTAASAFLDSFADDRARRYPLQRTLSIDWTAWEEVGMAYEHNAIDHNSLFGTIEKEEAIDVLFELINGTSNRYIVGKMNKELQKQITGKACMKISLPWQSEQEKPSHGSAESRKVAEVDRKNRNGSLSGPAERKQFVEEKWKEVLGLTQIDRNASFYDLGGDSILATDLVKRINEQIPDCIDVIDVFTYSSVNKMTEYIEKKTGFNKEPVTMQQSEEDNLEMLLAQLASGEIDRNEVEQKFQHKGE